MSSTDFGQSTSPMLQSSLGIATSQQTKKDRSWNHGYLALGRVLKVFPKRYTADVEIFHTYDKLHSANEQEGRHACRIGVGTAGFSDQYQAPYGEIIPIQRGNIVLVGFLKNSKEQPVILRVFHDISEDNRTANYRNILPNYFSSYTNIGDVLDYLKITPIQDFMKVDRFGNIELSSHTKSFFVASESRMVDDRFDYEDLSVKFPKDKTVINPLGNISNFFDVDTSGKSYYNFFDDVETTLSVETVHVEEKYSNPKKYMAVFRDRFQDAKTNWLKLIVDAAQTSFRVLKLQQDTNQSTCVEVANDGTVRIRRQVDNRMLYNHETPQTPINPTQNPSKVYSEIKLNPDGGIVLETIDRTTADILQDRGFASEGATGGDESKDFPHTIITINPRGGDISIETNSKLRAYAKAGIDMSSKNDINIVSEKAVNIASMQGINMTSDQDVNVTSKTTTRVSATNEVEMFAPDMYLTGAMDMKGSIDMKGQMDMVGNANFTGRHRVNHRGAILEGDEDTHDDTNLEFHSSYIVDIMESFMIKKLCTDLALNVLDASAIMGVVNVSTAGFTLPDVLFNGKATTMNTAAFGTLINENSPFHAMLTTFCEGSVLDPNSISTQIDFLQDSLGIDLNSLGDLAGIDITNLENVDEGTLLNGVVSAVGDFWKRFSHKNDLPTDSATALSKSHEFTLSATQIAALNTAYEVLDLTASPTNLKQDIGEVSRWQMTDTADLSKIVYEGAESKTVEYAQHGQDSTSTTIHEKATIEDALSSVSGYFPGGLFAQVKAVEEDFDAKTGLNSAQWCSTNRKRTYTTGGTGSGESSQTHREPAAITTIEQYVDRTVKRYVFSVGEKMLKQVNAAWKYYNYGM